VAWTIEELEEHLLIGSTLVEGSTLTEEEAQAVLAGRTVVGHPVREIRELTNYRWATQWLIESCQRFPGISMDVLLGYHARLMDGIAQDAGRFKAYSNYTIRSDGKRLDYRDPALVPSDLLRGSVTSMPWLQTPSLRELLCTHASRPFTRSPTETGASDGSCWRITSTANKASPFASMRAIGSNICAPSRRATTGSSTP
jgi:hypothetical protein